MLPAHDSVTAWRETGQVGVGVGGRVRSPLEGNKEAPGCPLTSASAAFIPVLFSSSPVDLDP